MLFSINKLSRILLWKTARGKSNSSGFQWPFDKIYFFCEPGSETCSTRQSEVEDSKSILSTSPQARNKRCF